MASVIHPVDVEENRGAGGGRREGGEDYWLTLLRGALRGGGWGGELRGGVGHSVLWLPAVPFIPLLRQRQNLLQRLRGTGACGCVADE